jgi:mono/diheme cytochrome c family protein
MPACAGMTVFAGSRRNLDRGQRSLAPQVLTIAGKEVPGMKHRLPLAAILVLAFSAETHAQDADIEAGAAYARKVCAGCHAVLANEQISPLPQAPTFQSVADTPGMTETALTVWLQTSHPTMPNIVLEPDDLRNVVAYIRSLERE